MERAERLKRLNELKENMVNRQASERGDLDVDSRVQAIREARQQEDIARLRDPPKDIIYKNQDVQILYNDDLPPGVDSNLPSIHGSQLGGLSR